MNNLPSFNFIISIAQFIQQETDNDKIHFQAYALLVFATVFHKLEIRDVGSTKTDELIQDIELRDQLMISLIRMKTVVTSLMAAIAINQILTLQRQICNIKEETKANRVAIYAQDASSVN